MRFALRLGGLLGATALAGLQVVPAAAGITQMETPAPNMVNPCNGELVLTTGSLHMAFVSNNRHLLIRSNFQNVKGVGAVTGLHYVVTGASQAIHENFDSPRAQAEITTIIIVHVIAPGTDQHFVSKLVFHEAGTPSGNVNVFTHMSHRCLGSAGKRRLVLGSLARSTSSSAPGERAPIAASNETNHATWKADGSQPSPVISSTTAARTVSTTAGGPKAGSHTTALAEPGSRPGERGLAHGRGARAH